MKCLTVRQKEILDFIQKYFFENNYWPSIRDIQHRFKFRSTNAVMGHLKALESKNYIARVPGQARAFRLSVNAQAFRMPGSAAQAVTIPIYGSIAAGYPDRVESGGAIGSLQIDVSTAGIEKLEDSFALKVRGDSMIDVGIFDGDIVIVEYGEPRHNDIVAALIDGETTLKRFINPEGAEVPYLKAENVNYPNLLPINTLEIQGIARSVVRCL